jgi:hypothetical protein
MIKRVLYLHFELSVNFLNSCEEIVHTLIEGTTYKFLIFICHLLHIAG